MTSRAPTDTSNVDEPAAASTVEADPDVFTFGLPSQDVVPAVAAIAGVIAALTGQQPTENFLPDLALSFVFAAGVTWIGRRAAGPILLTAALLALFFTGLQLPGLALGCAAALAAVATTSWRPLDQDSEAIVGAISAALTALTALHLPSIRFVGSASILAAIAIAPLLVFGYRALPIAERRVVRRVGAAAAAYAVIASALAVIVAFSVRDQVELGIDQADEGVFLLRFGDQPEALALLEDSQTNFDRAADRLRGPLMWPSRLVPVAAQHTRALSTAADQGSLLVATATRTVVQADVDKIRGRNGQLDVGLIEAVNAELTVANRSLISARESLLEVNSPWLLPALSWRLFSVNRELVTIGADIDLANHATSVMPGILGANGARRYLVLFVQPAESREFGGFVGAYGLLEVDNGRFDLTESGSIDPDFGAGVAHFTDVAQFPQSFVSAAPHINPQNLTATADLSTIAAAAKDLAPQWREDPSFSLDGIVTIDPYALAAMLQLTGPLFIADREDPITADNVVDFLLRDQYLEFEAFERDDRQSALQELAGQAFNRMLTIDLPGPEQLGAIFGPAARANRLSMVTFDAQENAFLERILLSADLPQVGSLVDMVGIYTQTGTASKLDAYASREISYDVTVDPATGDVTGELEIFDRNDAPPGANTVVLGRNEVIGPDGEPLDLGDNFLALGLYTRAEVSGLTASTQFRPSEPRPAFSYDRHRLFYTVPIGGSSRVTATLSSTVEPGRYDVFLPAQATASISVVTLTVRPTPGWRVVSEGVAPDGSWSQTFPLDEAHGFSFTFERTS